MKIGIVGSRSLNSDEVKEMVFSLLDQKKDVIECVVSGGAKGPDLFAYEWVSKSGGKFVLYRPDYKKHGKGAAFIRNTLIVEDSDVVVAFYDGKSNGTKDSINKALQRKKRVVVFTVDPVTFEKVMKKYNFD